MSEKSISDWSIWDLISHISSKDEILKWEDIENIYEPWVINRAFQADLIILDSLIVDLNRYASKIPKEVQYKILQKKVKKQKRYLKYLKDSKYESEIKILANWFFIKEEEMAFYMRFLSEDRIKYFLDMIERYEKISSGKNQEIAIKKTRRKK